jgi:hypothetical protein
MSEQRIAVVGTGANGAAIAAARGGEPVTRPNMTDAGFVVSGFNPWPPARPPTSRRAVQTVSRCASRAAGKVTRLDVHHLCEVARSPVPRP